MFMQINKIITVFKILLLKLNEFSVLVFRKIIVIRRPSIFGRMPAITMVNRIVMDIDQYVHHVVIGGDGFSLKRTFKQGAMSVDALVECLCVCIK